MRALSELIFGVYLRRGIIVEGFQVVAIALDVDVLSFGAMACLVLLSFVGATFLWLAFAKTLRPEWTIA